MSDGPTHPATARIAVELLVFEHFDLLDLGGPYEVLLTANRLAGRQGRSAPFVVSTLGWTGEQVRAYGGLRVTPDRGLADDPDRGPAPDPGRASVPDPGPASGDAADTRVLVVPGAIDVDAVVADGTTLPAIQRAAGRAQLLTSVCTGSLLLGAAGLLSSAGGATTHHEDLAALGRYLDPARVIGGVAWVDAGGLVTAGGLANGLSMALHLVHRLVDRQLAENVAFNLSVPWSPEDGVTVPGAPPRS